MSGDRNVAAAEAAAVARRAIAALEDVARALDAAQWERAAIHLSAATIHFREAQADIKGTMRTRAQSRARSAG